MRGTAVGSKTYSVSEPDLPAETGRKLLRMFHLLFERFGPQDWWPAETELEVMVGAILTQNTNWKNVEKAINNLKRKGLLSLDALASLKIDELAEEIRPAGYFNVKAARLKNLIVFVQETYHGELSRCFNEETDVLREGFLSVKGVGPETADSMLLYAAGKPVFVVDTYTFRVMHRHGLVFEGAGYEVLQDIFMANLPQDVGLFNEFHALIVQVGKHFCGKKPRCEECPLQSWQREN
jgi:endonuclease-3 related protein